MLHQFSKTDGFDAPCSSNSDMLADTSISNAQIPPPAIHEDVNHLLDLEPVNAIPVAGSQIPLASDLSSDSYFLESEFEGSSSPLLSSPQLGPELDSVHDHPVGFQFDGLPDLGAFVTFDWMHSPLAMDSNQTAAGASFPNEAPSLDDFVALY